MAGPTSSSRDTTPSSQAMRVAQAVIIFDSEAKRYERDGSPRRATTDPLRSTAAEACGTGQVLTTSRRRSGKARRANELGHAECQVEALAGVESRIAHRLVAMVEIFDREIVGATETFGHVVAGEFDVDAARPSAFRAVRVHEAGDLADDVVEVACLQSG